MSTTFLRYRTRSGNGTSTPELGESPSEYYNTTDVSGIVPGTSRQACMVACATRARRDHRAIDRDDAEAPPSGESLARCCDNLNVA